MALDPRRYQRAVDTTVYGRSTDRCTDSGVIGRDSINDHRFSYPCFTRRRILTPLRARVFTRTSAQRRGRPPGTIENDAGSRQNQAGSTFRSFPTRCTICATWTAGAAARSRCQRQNRYVAEQQNKYPGKIYGMASIVPYGGDPFLREFERAVKQDGLKGAWILSSLQGSYPDDDDAFPFFQLACELDVPVVIHPPSSRLRRGAHARLSAGIVGRPADGRRAGGGASHCPRRVRETAKAEGGCGASWRRYLRDDRPHGLCLPASGRVLFSAALTSPCSSNINMLSLHLKMLYLESTSYWLPGGPLRI